MELNDTPKNDTGLQRKTVTLVKYAYYKHVGPYNLLKQVRQNMRDELKSSGFEIIFPYIEIYGHWANDETKPETELLMNLI